jgi:hypothetical protein
MIKVVPYTPELRTVWDTFVPKCKNAPFLFLRSYMDYHKERFDDSSLMIYHYDRLAALFPANRKNECTIVSHEGLTYGGLLISYDEYSENTILYFAELLRYCHDAGISKLVFKQIPSFYSSVSCEDIDYALFLAKAKISRVDLNSTLDLRSLKRISYQRRRKKGIKVAQKNGIQIVETSDFRQFWNEILIPNLLQRHGAHPVHSLQDIEHLCNENSGCIRQFNAYNDGRIMAGCTIFEMNNIARAQYFSGCNEGRKNGSLDYLIHYLIEEVFHNKHYFDFGNSNLEQGQKVNSGLLAWKGGFGARSFAQRFYDVETSNYKLIIQAFI